MLTIPLHAIFAQMRSLPTKYRYTQRLARSTKRDTSSPFYGQQAPSLYHYRLSPINQQMHKVFSVTFLLLWFRGARIHTVDKLKEQGKKKSPSWIKMAVLSCTLVLWTSSWGNWGGKSKAEGCSKAKGPFLGTFFMRRIGDLLICGPTQKMWDFSLFQKHSGVNILSFRGPQGAKRQFTSSLLHFSCSSLQPIPGTDCHVSLSIKNSVSSVWEFPF